MAIRFFSKAVTLLAFMSILSVANAVEVSFQSVSPGVYAYIGDIEGRTYDNEGLNANIGLVVTRDGALLIDSGASYQGAEKIAKAVQKVTTQPIKWVINTGGQDHRWLGNGYFKAHGAEIMAHADALPDMKARTNEHMSGLKATLKERFDGTVPTYPTTWLKEKTSRLDLGGVQVVVEHRAGGHTPGDSVVWLPKSRVAFAGDVVYVDRVLGMHPVSKSKAWLDSFAMLEALNPVIIIPGHGQVTDLRMARAQTKDLLSALRAHMARAIDAGQDMDSAIKSFDATPFKQLKHAEVWIPQLANQTYLEIEQE